MFRLRKKSTSADTVTPKRMLSRIPKPLRNAALSVVVLGLVFLGAGTAYTLYMDSNPVQNTAAIAPAAHVTAEPVIKHNKPAANANESAAIDAFTTPVPLGANASISVHTLPSSTCTITVVYNKVASKDSGLKSKIADDYGTVSWSWTVGSDTPPGTWPVTVTCFYHTRSGVVVGNLEVTKS